MTQTDEPKPADTPAAEPEATPEPASAPEAKGFPWTALVVVVLGLALAIGIAVSWPYWKDKVMPPRAAPAVAATDDLRAELAETRERLRRLEAAAARPAETGAPADLGPVEGRLGKLESDVRTLQLQPQVPARLVDDVAALQGQLAELKKTVADAAAVLRIADRLDKVEAELREIQAQRSSATALLLAVGQLREAVNLSMPFDAELRSVRALAGAEAGTRLDALKSFAAAGIPTRLVLAERFEALSVELVRASVLPEQRGWWRDTLRQLAGIINIRREDGETAGTSAAAAVARAQQHLRQNDLSAAVAEAATLTGSAAETAAPWLADARARLEADKVLSELTADVVAQLGAAAVKR